MSRVYLWWGIDWGSGGRDRGLGIVNESGGIGKAINLTRGALCGGAIAGWFLGER
jgi:hypothetical protein